MLELILDSFMFHSSDFNLTGMFEQMHSPLSNKVCKKNSNVFYTCRTAGLASKTTVAAGPLRALLEIMKILKLECVMVILDFKDCSIQFFENLCNAGIFDFEHFWQRNCRK